MRQEQVKSIKAQEIEVKALSEMKAFIERADKENIDKFLVQVSIREVTYTDLKKQETAEAFVVDMEIFNNEVDNGPLVDRTYVRFAADTEQEEIFKMIESAFPSKEQIEEMSKQEAAKRAFQEQMQQQLAGMTPEQAAAAVNQMKEQK